MAKKKRRKRRRAPRLPYGLEEYYVPPRLHEVPGTSVCVIERGERVVVRFTARDLLTHMENGGRWHLRKSDAKKISALDRQEFALRVARNIAAEGEIFVPGKKNEELMSFEELIFYFENIDKGLDRLYEVQLKRKKLSFQNLGTICSLEGIPVETDFNGADLAANGLKMVFSSANACGEGSALVADLNGLLPRLAGKNYFFHESTGPGGYKCLSVWLDERKALRKAVRETCAPLSLAEIHAQRRAAGKARGIKWQLQEEREEDLAEYAPKSAFVRGEMGKTAWENRRRIRDLLALERHVLCGMVYDPRAVRLVGKYGAEYEEILKELNPGAYGQYALEKETRVKEHAEIEEAVNKAHAEEKGKWLRAGGKP